MNNKPVPIVILSMLAMLNGVAAFALGVATLLGSRLLFTADGYGPNRIAVSELFGPFADHTGWIVLFLGAFFAMVGYGLYNFRQWARLAVFWAFAILATATVFACGWGFVNREWGMVVGGALKICVEVGLCLYLMTARVRSAFTDRAIFGKSG